MTKHTVVSKPTEKDWNCYNHYKKPDSHYEPYHHTNGKHINYLNSVIKCLEFKLSKQGDEDE